MEHRASGSSSKGAFPQDRQGDGHLDLVEEGRLKAVRLAVELAGPGALVDGQFDWMNGTRSPHVVSVGSTQRSLRAPLDGQLRTD
jgi:hypothetical protein